MTLPVVIIHQGYKEYLKVNLEITGINNVIYLIGDDDVEHLGQLNNVTFVNINKYSCLSVISEARDSFVNYSSNPEKNEWRCFERVFILKYFMKEININRIFHIDSDNILLHDINTYPFDKEIAYCLSKNYNNAYRMSCSIHSALINQVFCEKYLGLFNDLYINKSKFYLIEDKVKFHSHATEDKYINGGVCDMTLYYLLASENIIDAENLLIPKNGVVFINNINNGEGYEKKEQYRIKDELLEITFDNYQCTIYDEIKDETLNLFNIHYQGGSKKMMTEELKEKHTRRLRV